MTKWDRRFLDLAALVASWSKDPSSQVGAVIADRKNRVVSLGYNGFPRNIRDDLRHMEDRDEKLRRTIHAEGNAILFARGSVEGCTMYVTHCPCARCAATIVQAGISRVITLPMPVEFEARWAMDTSSALLMFNEAGVSFEEMGR